MSVSAPLVVIEGLAKAFGDRSLFDDLSLAIHEGERLGLIGPNGAGKSTLLNLMAGALEPDAGRLAINQAARIEILSQEPDLDDALSALSQVLIDGPPEFEVVRAYDEACRALSVDPQDSARLDRVTALAEEMDRISGWTLEQDAKRTLGQLGIDDPSQLIGEMSGGQRKRVALARALVRPADLLVLDEPTNHLDVETISWLEDHLAARQGALLLVTHDRYILDRVSTAIIELFDRQLYRFAGNYSAYLEASAEREAQREAAEAKRANLARRELEWLRRGPKARTSKSKYRVERAKALQNPLFSRQESDVAIDAASQRLGKKVVLLEGVSKSFGDRTVLAQVSLGLVPGDRLGIVGPNGAGKSTLLNLMTGRLSPDAGTIEVGSTVAFGYVDQGAEGLDPELRVHDYISEISNRITTSDGVLTATQMLERFNFARPRQWQPIAKLSGGERRRLYLLGILARQPNVLLLDEPTNDLDVATLSALEAYLDTFPGVVVAVSHDRYFLDRIADRLLVVDGQGHALDYPGSFSDWLEHKRRREAEAASEARAARKQTKPKAAAPAGPSVGKLKRQLRDLEARIAEIEQGLEAKQASMLEVSEQGDYTSLGALQSEREALEAELDEVMARWEEVALALEEAG